MLILADEPTGELDSYTAREILSLFRTILRQENTALVVTTHDPKVFEYADTPYELTMANCIASKTNRINRNASRKPPDIIKYTWTLPESPQIKRT